MDRREKDWLWIETILLPREASSRICRLFWRVKNEHNNLDLSCKIAFAMLYYISLIVNLIDYSRKTIGKG